MSASPPSIRSAFRKIAPYLIQAAEQSLNEADTVRRIVKVFEDVLEYDGMTEISREALIKGKYVDLAIKLDGATKILVEVKAAGTILRDRHIDQARAYAADGNLRWVVLTNGTSWNLYHLTFEEGIEHDLVFSVEVAPDRIDDVADALAVLHRDSVRKGLHEDLWNRKSALSAQSLGRALFSESVLRIVRREVRLSEGISVDEEDLASGIKMLFSPEAREQMGPIKIRRRKRKRQVQTTTGEPTSEEIPSVAPDEPSGEPSKESG
jgi:predicted type IV restriction endonuclease